MISILLQWSYAMARVMDVGKEAVWRERLRRFQKSRLTVAEFCRSEGVSAPTFYQWRKRLAERGRRGVSGAAKAVESFVPVRLTTLGAATSAMPPVQIHLPNGAKVCFPSGDRTALRVGIRAAGELPGLAKAPAVASPAAEAARC
jgi:transposase-like protein